MRLRRITLEFMNQFTITVANINNRVIAVVLTLWAPRAYNVVNYLWREIAYKVSLTIQGYKINLGSKLDGSL